MESDLSTCHSDWNRTQVAASLFGEGSLSLLQQPSPAAPKTRTTSPWSPLRQRGVTPAAPHGSIPSSTLRKISDMIEIDRYPSRMTARFLRKVDVTLTSCAITWMSSQTGQYSITMCVWQISAFDVSVHIPDNMQMMPLA